MMYFQAPKDEKVTHIHLFGIKYAADLAELSLSEVVGLAGLPMTYVTEVSKGKNLAKYVAIND